MNTYDKNERCVICGICLDSCHEVVEDLFCQSCFDVKDLEDLDDLQ